MFTHGICTVTDGVAAHRAIEPYFVILPDVYIECGRVIGVIPTMRAEYQLNSTTGYEYLLMVQSMCGMEGIQAHTLGMVLDIVGRKQLVILIIETVEKILEMEFLFPPTFCQMELLLSLHVLQHLYKLAWEDIGMVPCEDIIHLVDALRHHA